jgi:hypothetical protein
MDISIRARFERFPATVKGAFVARGEDANPHLVSFREGRVVPIAGKGGIRIPMKPVLIDVPPHQDVYLPFEFSTTDLGPGWYGLECDLDVDAVSRTMPGGRRFAVQWPRATVRRGSIAVDKTLSLGKVILRLEQLDCVSDHVVLHYGVEPSHPVSLKLLADGERLGELSSEFDGESGEGTVEAYPLMRTHSSLRIEATGRGKAAGEVAEILQLP